MNFTQIHKTMNHIKEGVKGKIDPTDGNTIYTGYPMPGTTSESSSTWAIKRVQIDPATEIITEMWAGGTTECTYKWSDRASLEYSFLK